MTAMSHKALVAIFAVLLLPAVAHAQEGWATLLETRAVGAGGAVVESAWSTTRPPGGPYDRIVVRRYTRAGNVDAPRPVLFYLPGTNMNGRAAVTDERYNLWMYLAARGVDVYTMDYRTAAVPADAPADLSFMAEWTYGRFLGDIEAAVALARTQSGRARVFIGGFSRGVSLAYLYAARHWRTDLCGIVALDGGLKSPRADPVDLQKTTAEMKEAQRFASDIGGRTGWEGRQALMRGAAATPPGPAPDGTHASAAEQLASVLYSAWGPGALSNARHGYADPQVLATLLEGYDRFYPAVQEIEGRALAAIDDHPDLSYDDGLREVGLPVLAINGTGMGLPFLLSGLYTASLLATKDVTVHVLEGYGHLDVIVGTRAREEVFEPVRRWIDERAACRF
jgi:dienelactone hydrolase